MKTIRQIVAICTMSVLSVEVESTLHTIESNVRPQVQIKFSQ